MIPTPEQIAELRALSAAATPGPWIWWTSNSFRRLGTPDRDGCVLYGYVQRSDGHPDVQVSEADAALIAAMRNALIPALDHIEELVQEARDADASVTIEREDRRAAEKRAEAAEARVKELVVELEKGPGIFDRYEKALAVATEALELMATAGIFINPSDRREHARAALAEIAKLRGGV